MDSNRQSPPSTVRVATVVTFYMTAALVVRSLSHLTASMLIPIVRWFSCASEKLYARSVPTHLLR